MIAEYERAQIAERTRRGKRHRARAGCVNVLCAAPYGYRYVRRTELADAHYMVVESEAEIVREVYALYTQELWSIAAITRELNRRGVPTRFGKQQWERSTIWGMLRNPAYQGRACFGKTERAERQRITKRLRAKGGYSPRSGAHRERRREEWIEIPVPALVSEAGFGLAQERLAENRRLSARRTKRPTLLQGILVCAECGHSLCCRSAKATRPQARYYRCIGSERYRHLPGPLCSCRPIRQDYLDDLIWTEVMRLLNEPQLVRAEIERRLQESLSSAPAQQRREHLEKELTRVRAQLDKLLDAYQEELMSLTDLRKRAPALRRRQSALENELRSVSLQAIEHGRLIELSSSMENFLAQLKQRSQSLDVLQRQKIVRMLIRQIIVGKDTLIIEHCLPVSGTPADPPGGSSLLCTWSHRPAPGLSEAVPGGQARRSYAP